MSRKQRLVEIRLVAVLIVVLIAAHIPWGRSVLAEPGTYAEAAALIDVESGRILWSHQGDKRMLIASTTKIMTAIVAIEEGNLSDRVTVSKNAFGKEGSSIYLRLGEEMSLEHLLYGMMLRSGNDAATAIAEHVGGSVEGFAFLMNRKAEEIGMDHSHFVNPHGLNADDHYSTANDMAKLAAYALGNPVFREIVKTEVKKAPNPNEPWDYTWYNKNKMLRLYDGADGIKTGYTKKAGRCLVSSATRDGVQLAAVTLNDPNDWADHARMLDYGFSQYTPSVLIGEGDAVDGHPNLAAAATFRYPLSDEEIRTVRSVVELEPDASLSRKFGQAGMIHFYLGKERIGSVPLVERPADAFQHSEAGWMPVLRHLIKELFRWSI